MKVKNLMNLKQTGCKLSVTITDILEKHAASISRSSKPRRAMLETEEGGRMPL